GLVSHQGTLKKGEKRKERGLTGKGYWGLTAASCSCCCFPSSAVSSDSSREVLEWRESFDQLLKSKNGVTAFHTFLKTEFSEENLDFWLACEDFKKTRSKTKLASKANRIFEEFVQSEAPREVNIDHETREITRKNLTGATSACFNEAQAKTRTLMEKDSYPRFLKSASYQDMTKQATSRSINKRLHT
uniref:Regulator of G-protein signaling 16 n=1 Tax=Gallus gallus TaxID=9031 RepID=A0A8V0YF43_CHICK